MNHLKTFETFFSFYKLDKIPEDIALGAMGVNRELLEDYLIPIQDKIINTVVSINYVALDLDTKNNNKFRSSGFVSDVVKAPNNTFTSKSWGGWKPLNGMGVTISFFPNQILCERISEKWKDKEFNKTWYELVTDGVDLEDELESFRNYMEKLGFSVKIEKRRGAIKNEDLFKFTTYSSHPELKEDKYGLSFLTIDLSKKLNTKK
jgi:hypothetical protein